LRLHLFGYFSASSSPAFSFFSIRLSSGFLIDDVIPRRRLAWLPIVAAAFFSYLCGAGWDLTASQQCSTFRAVQKMIFRSRLSLLRHLQRLSAEYHDNRPLGDTLQPSAD